MKQTHAESNMSNISTPTMIRFAVRIPKSLQKRLAIHKAKTGVGFQDFTTAALIEKLDRDKKGVAA